MTVKAYKIGEVCIYIGFTEAEPARCIADDCSHSAPPNALCQCCQRRAAAFGEHGKPRGCLTLHCPFAPLHGDEWCEWCAARIKGGPSDHIAKRLSIALNRSRGGS